MKKRKNQQKEDKEKNYGREFALIILLVSAVLSSCGTNGMDKS